MLRTLVNIKNDSRFALFMSLAILYIISNSQSDNDSVNIANKFTEDIPNVINRCIAIYGEGAQRPGVYKLCAFSHHR